VDRDAFLARVGKAAMSSALPEPPDVAGPDPAEPSGAPRPGRDDLVALFRRRALDVNAVAHGPVSRHGAAKVVAGVAAGHDAETFMAWDDLTAPGVDSALLASGLRRVDHMVPAEGRVDHQSGYRDLDMGVTGALAGLAESGSIVLSHGPGRPRMASLIAETHVALVDVTTIAPTLAHWAAGRPEAATETANLVIVTGPSRTGDIEQQLNLGVHGPRHLHLVLLK